MIFGQICGFPQAHAQHMNAVSHCVGISTSVSAAMHKQSTSTVADTARLMPSTPDVGGQASLRSSE